MSVQADCPVHEIVSLYLIAKEFGYFNSQQYSGYFYQAISLSTVKKKHP